MKSIKDLNLKKILSFFLQQNGSPLFNAKGIALGVFSGCFPFFGFQTFMGVFLARIFNGNVILAALGTWISNPLTYIPLYFFNYKVGSFILNSPNPFLIEPNLIKEDFWRQGWFFTSRLILGSSLVGSSLAIILGSIFYIVYIKFMKK